MKKTIHVHVIDEATGNDLMTVDLPLDELPDSLEPGTELTIGENEFNVVSAKPAHSSKFSETGELTLRVYRIMMVSPADILFSLPTISDELPQLSPNPLGEGQFHFIREDDWRQIEFVSTSHQDNINACLDAIDRIYEDNDTPGFKSLHNRTEVPKPLEAGALKLSYFRDVLLDLIPDAAYDAITFFGEEHGIENGFCFQTPFDLHIYGLADGETITVLCLNGFPADHEDARYLARLADENNLCLVDWCAATAFSPEDGTFVPQDR